MYIFNLCPGDHHYFILGILWFHIRVFASKYVVAICTSFCIFHTRQQSIAPNSSHAVVASRAHTLMGDMHSDRLKDTNVSVCTICYMPAAFVLSHRTQGYPVSTFLTWH